MPQKNDKKQPPKKRVYFTLSAPEAQKVILSGVFNNWETGYTLKRDKKGTWNTFLMLEPGIYEYRFLVDGQWQNDPGAEVAPNPYGTQNCIRVVPDSKPSL